MVVYIDSVFVLNTLADYLILFAAAQLSGRPLQRLRLLAAAALGGAYAVCVFLPGCGFLTGLPAKVAAGVLMCTAAFAGQPRFLRQTLLVFSVSCGFAGCVLALGLLANSAIPMADGIFYTNIDAKVLLISATAAYLIFAVVFRACARQSGHRGNLLETEIALQGRQVRLTALADSGNSLRDPSTGRPVLVVSADCLNGLWPPAISGALSPTALTDPALALERLHDIGGFRLRFQLLPCRTVTAGGSLLLAVRSDWVRVGKRKYEKLLIALSPTVLGNGFSALWGGEVRKGEGKDAASLEPFAAAAGSPGPPAGAAHSLHRRQ